MTTDRIGLCFEPLDVLFFRDGRPFGAGAHGVGGLPLPQTVAGALATAILRRAGCDFQRLGEALGRGAELGDAVREANGPTWWDQLWVRGPWLARRDAAGGVSPLIPAPATLQAAQEDPSDDQPCTVLAPLGRRRNLPGWRDQRLRPLWPQAQGARPPRGKRASGYLDLDAAGDFLAQQPVLRSRFQRPDALYDFDRRTGIGIQPDRLTAEESLIYSAKFLALRPAYAAPPARAAPGEGAVVLYVEVDWPAEAPRDWLPDGRPIPLGGEGRRARLEVLPAPCRWPDPPAFDDRRKPLVMLTTPGLFQNGAAPAALADRLAAAAVPGWQPVSGWDLARGGPKPSRFAVPAGSVYFLDRPLDRWPRSLADLAADQRQGWGCYLIGAWNDE